MNEFYLIKDKYEELQKSDDFKKIAFMLAETEDLLSAYKDYYNDNASKYNKVIKCFPVCIISLLKGRKEKLFFDSKNSSDNDYNDFKNIIRKQIKTVIDDMLTEEITKIDQIDFYYTLIHTSKQILYMNENVVNVYILL